MWRQKLVGKFIVRDAFAAAFTIVDPVVNPLGQRVFTHGATSVVGDVINVWREKTLIRLVNARADVRPPEKRLHVGRAIVGAHFQLDDGLAGMEAHAMHALHATYRIVVAAPDDF